MAVDSPPLPLTQSSSCARALACGGRHVERGPESSRVETLSSGSHFGRAEVSLFSSRELTHCHLFFSLQKNNVPLRWDRVLSSKEPLQEQRDPHSNPAFCQRLYLTSTYLSLWSYSHFPLVDQEVAHCQDAVCSVWVFTVYITCTQTIRTGVAVSQMAEQVIH